MAITKYYGWSVTVIGDGTSTSFDWDMRDLIKQSGVYPASPVGIFSCSSSTSPAVASSSLSGTVLTVNFASAPAGGSFNSISAALEF